MKKILGYFNIQLNLNKITCDFDRNKFVRICLLIWLVIVLIGLKFIDVARYQNKPIKEYVDMFISLFAITVIVERSIAVIFQFARVPGLMLLEQKLVDEVGRYDYWGNITTPEKQDERLEQLKEWNKAIRLTKHQIRMYRKDNKILMTLVGLLICTVITVCGVRILHQFVNVNDMSCVQKTIFRFIDIILTAVVLAGGSQGLHALASTILRFIQEVTNQKTYSRKSTSKGGLKKEVQRLDTNE
ncbi:hypothetical protein [Methylomonas sp. CM2]|uniref:hypothetical protein n=1 Tax=Methylomonas sp. CM2 TaxID=3417647 RepID=UPI003CF2218A